MNPATAPLPTTLAVHTELDPVLAAIAPLGLAAAAGRPCLVIDLDPLGPPYPGERSLADIARDGPSRPDLGPGPRRNTRSGIAVLRNGDITLENAADLIAGLIRHWPAVVLRLPMGQLNLMLPAPVIPVVPLLPGILAPRHPRAAVWQLGDDSVSPPGPGPILPRLRIHQVSNLLAVQRIPQGPWVRAWRRVWELPWAIRT
ncbi:MAG TPA: hypothetical protein VIA81_09770 [Acidimicrobiia bacterium]|jgi:hypothetical protein